MLYDVPNIIQTAFVNITSNVSTTSTTYVDLAPLTITLTTSTHPIEVHFSGTVGILSNRASVGFQLMVDGVAVSNGLGRVQISGNPAYTTSIGIVYKSGVLSSGSHTVKIQWKTSAGTASIQPSGSSYGYAGLLVKEVAF